MALVFRRLPDAGRLLVRLTMRELALPLSGKSSMPDLSYCLCAAIGIGLWKRSALMPDCRG